MKKLFKYELNESIAAKATMNCVHKRLFKENYRGRHMMPEMEQNDIKQALTQYLDEIWIDASEDGDLEELYYAVSDYLDSTGDYPASAEWEDCKPWCEEHYQDIENLFLGGSLY